MENNDDGPPALPAAAAEHNHELAAVATPQQQARSQGGLEFIQKIMIKESRLYLHMPILQLLIDYPPFVHDLCDLIQSQHHPVQNAHVQFKSITDSDETTAFSPVDEQLLASLASIGRALSGCDAFTKVTVVRPPDLAYCNALVDSCRNVKELVLDLDHEIERNTEELEDFAASLSMLADLESLDLDSIKLPILAALGPAIATLPKLRSFSLRPSPWSKVCVTTMQDAEAICQIVQSNSLMELDMQWMDFVAADATELVFAAMKNSQIKKLAISLCIFPNGSEPTMAKAMVGMPYLTDLVFSVPIRQRTFFSTFLEELQSSPESALEQVCLSKETGPGLTHWIFMQMPRELDSDWKQQVQRILDLNRERRETRRDFEAFAVTLGQRPMPVYWAAVFQASPTIVFRHMRNGDQYLLVKAIQDVTASTHGPYEGAAAAAAQPSKLPRT